MNQPWYIVIIKNPFKRTMRDKSSKSLSLQNNFGNYNTHDDHQTNNYGRGTIEIKNGDFPSR